MSGENAECRMQLHACAVTNFNTSCARQWDEPGMWGWVGGGERQSTCAGGRGVFTFQMTFIFYLGVGSCQRIFDNFYLDLIKNDGSSLAAHQPDPNFTMLICRKAVNS